MVFSSPTFEEESLTQVKPEVRVESLAPLQVETVDSSPPPSYSAVHKDLSSLPPPYSPQMKVSSAPVSPLPPPSQPCTEVDKQIAIACHSVNSNVRRYSGHLPYP